MFTRLFILPSINKNFLRFNSKKTSDVTRIDVKDSNPISLFREWLEEGEKFNAKACSMNLATAKKNGEVSSRTVGITEIMADASVAFVTQCHSQKIKTIGENSQVAASIILNYDQQSVHILRQIGLMGRAVKLPGEKCLEYFTKNLTFSEQIRFVLTQKTGCIEWGEFKINHDALIKEWAGKEGKIKMPDSLVAYKIVPHTFDFYYSREHTIGDRLIFTKDKNDKWNYERRFA